MISYIPVRVECYSGSRSEEIPRALYWEDRRFEVEEILDRWYEGSRDPTVPSADYYKISTSEGGKYLLKHERALHIWYLVSELE